MSGVVLAFCADARVGEVAAAPPDIAEALSTDALASRKSRRGNPPEGLPLSPGAGPPNFFAMICFPGMLRFSVIPIFARYAVISLFARHAIINVENASDCLASIVRWLAGKVTRLRFRRNPQSAHVHPLTKILHAMQIYVYLHGVQIFEGEGRLMWGFAKSKQEAYRAEVAGLDRAISVRQDETVLSALLRQQVAVKHLCLVGECGSCRCKLTSGRVRLKRDVSARLSEADMRRGYILACQSIALDDLKIDVPGVGTSFAALDGATDVPARIEEIRRLAHNVVELTLRPESQVAFSAGQFATIRCTAEPELADATRCYSFADAPTDAEPLRFHVRHVPGGLFTEWLFAADRTGSSIAITGVAGSFGYHSSERAIVCIAGGTGLAPIRSMLHSLAKAGKMPDVTLMLAARTQADLYGISDLERLMTRWQRRFSIVPILSHESAQSAWTGLRGYCTNHFDPLGTLADHDFYVCGPPAMIDAVADRLRGQIPESQLHVDRFLDQSSIQ